MGYVGFRSVFLSQVLQQDIESHSKIVSAVLKLCEHLKSDDGDAAAAAAAESSAASGEKSGRDSEGLRLIAVHLERRWHAVWLQSLEWQCRLEEAVTRGKVSTVTSSAASC